MNSTSCNALIAPFPVSVILLFDLRTLFSFCKAGVLNWQISYDGKLFPVVSGIGYPLQTLRRYICFYVVATLPSRDSVERFGFLWAHRFLSGRLQINAIIV